MQPTQPRVIYQFNIEPTPLCRSTHPLYYVNRTCYAPCMQKDSNQLNIFFRPANYWHRLYQPCLKQKSYDDDPVPSRLHICVDFCFLHHAKSRYKKNSPPGSPFQEIMWCCVYDEIGVRKEKVNKKKIKQMACNTIQHECSSSRNSDSGTAPQSKSLCSDKQHEETTQYPMQ